MVSADHPRVTQAIDSLSARGVPVFALISDLSAPSLAGYVGLDNWKVGRTAAWAVAQAVQASRARSAIFVGSHRYRCQETCEMSFRSYFREHAPEFRLLEPRTSLEDARYAYESTARPAAAESEDLVALFVAGGGVEGVIRAHPRGGRRRARHRYRSRPHRARRAPALIDGVLKLVLSHPLQRMAETLVGAMVARPSSAGAPTRLARVLLPFDIHTPENV